ncbi:MAG: IMS domain-containing protein [Cyanobacteria bacterium P01_A01_bin.80]
MSTLGSGGFGETFLAEDTQMPSGRHCVIKKLKPVATNEPQIDQLIRERFGREAAILEELGDSSSQIPKLYAYFNEDEDFYLVQEYIEGQTLTHKLEQEGLMSESTLRAILIDILPVLSYVHSKGIVHRDIKPDNIMIRSFDGKAVLIDFGAVKETMGTIMSASGNSGKSIVIGTPGFMPMEQSVGRPQFGSDIYSLGLTAIYLLTGKIPQLLETNPHTGEVIWHSNISPTMRTVLNKAIKPVARDRYSSATEMLADLQPIANTFPATVPNNQAPAYNNNHTPEVAATVASNLPPQPPTVNNQAAGHYGQAPQVNPNYQQPNYQQPNYQQPNYQQTVPPTSNGLGTWQQAVIIGGVIGLFITGSWFVMGLMRNNTDTNPVITTPPTTTTSIPATTNPQPVEPSVAQSPTNPPISSPEALISREDAYNTVENWIKAKGEIFAPPYRTELGEQLLTSSAYRDNIKRVDDADSCLSAGGSDGACLSSAEWLERNNSRWVYGVQRIDEVKNFQASGNKATLVVRVTEKRTLYGSTGKVDKTQSGLFDETTSYDLVYENGQVKISNYN